MRSRCADSCLISLAKSRRKRLQSRWCSWRPQLGDRWRIEPQRQATGKTPAEFGLTAGRKTRKLERNQAASIGRDGGWGVKTVIAGPVVLAVTKFALVTASAAGAKNPDALRGYAIFVLAASFRAISQRAPTLMTSA